MDKPAPFHIHFALVAVLFLLFDVEVAFLFPYVRGWRTISRKRSLVVILFLLILTFGLWYEFQRKALEW